MIILAILGILYIIVYIIVKFDLDLSNFECKSKYEYRIEWVKKEKKSEPKKIKAEKKK